MVYIYISVPLVYVLDIFVFKRVNILSLDLIFTSKVFHNKIEDVKKVLPSSDLLFEMS